MIVVDASVAVKWYIAEPQSAEAIALLAEHQGQILVPDLFVLEVQGALVRRANMQKARRDEATVAIASFAALLAEEMVVCEHTLPADVARAAQIALDIGHPLKDCIYLALAIKNHCSLVTADVHFAAKAREVYGAVQVLGE